MKRSMWFLFGQAIIVFFMVIFTDFSYIPKGLLGFLWALWACVVAVSYAILTREEVDCRCFERSEEE